MGSRARLHPVVLLLVTSLASGVPGVALAEPAAGDVTAEAKRAVVKIHKNDRVVATGFLVSRRGHVLTAKHAIENAIATPISFCGGGGETVMAAVVDVHDTFDLALLRIRAEGRLPEPLHLRSETLSPGRGDLLALGHGKVDDGTLHCQQEVASLRNPDVFGRITIGGQLTTGFSGGPLIDEDGRVVGVLLAQSGQTDATYVLPSRYVEAFLLRNGIHFPVGMPEAYYPDTIGELRMLELKYETLNRIMREVLVEIRCVAAPKADQEDVLEVRCERRIHGQTLPRSTNLRIAPILKNSQLGLPELVQENLFWRTNVDLEERVEAVVGVVDLDEVRRGFRALLVDYSRRMGTEYELDDVEGMLVEIRPDPLEQGGDDLVHYPNFIARFDYELD
jgi:hypothetical protein